MMRKEICKIGNIAAVKKIGVKKRKNEPMPWAYQSLFERASARSSSLLQAVLFALLTWKTACICVTRQDSPH
jgi:hypothetical protein